MDVMKAIGCLGNCIMSYPKESRDGNAVVNSVAALIHSKQIPPEGAMAEVIQKRNEMVKALLLIHENVISAESKSAIEKMCKSELGMLSVQFNAFSRYGWINQNHPHLANDDTVTHNDYLQSLQI